MLFTLFLRHPAAVILLVITHYSLLRGVTGASPVVLAGAGATFPAGVYISWMAAYRSMRAQFVDVQMSYAARGSGFGKAAIANATGYGISYAGTDSVLTAADYAKSPNIAMFPSIAGAIVLGYNLPGVTNLVLTREQVVGIYNGSITRWSDPTFVANNPMAKFPNASIVPVARLDSSGSTEIFTRALSSFSAEWNRTYGVFTSKSGWNQSVVKTFGQRTTGIADTVNDVPYRIGYLPPFGASEVLLPYAGLLNKHGIAVPPTADAVQQSMRERLSTEVIVDCDGPDTYPIAGFSYFIVHLVETGDCRTSIELTRYIIWFTTSNQANEEADNQMMVAVSEEIADRIRTQVLDRLTCNGRSTMHMVDQQNYDEQESLKTWKVPVEVATPIVFVLIVVLIMFAMRQRLLLLRMLNRDDWKIAFFEIEFHAQKTREAKTTSKQVSFGKSSSDAKQAAPRGASDVTTFEVHGTWNVQEISVRKFFLNDIFAVNRKVRYTLVILRESVSHMNVAKFYGLSNSGDEMFLVEDYFEKGTLRDLLRNSRYQNQMTDSMRYTIAADIANGMNFLHGQNIVHGNLTTSSCKVDSHFTVKITNWEYVVLYKAIRQTAKFKNNADPSKTVLAYFKKNTSPDTFICAPELINGGQYGEPTRAADVYNFGFIVEEIFKLDASNEDPINADDISTFESDASPGGSKLMPSKARQIVSLARCTETIKRPTFELLEKALRSAVSSGGGSLIDSMLQTMELYANELESKLAIARQSNSDLLATVDRLLRRVMPPTVINRLWSLTGQPSTTHGDDRLQQVLVETSEAACLIGLQLEIINESSPSTAEIDDEITSLTSKFVDTVDEELTNQIVDAVGLERSSSTVVMATFSVERLDTVALLAVQVVKKMEALWKMSSLRKSETVSCSFLAALHTGRIVCGLENSGYLPNYVIHGHALDVVHGLLGMRVFGAKSTFNLIVTEDAGKLIGDKAIEKILMPPLTIINTQYATYRIETERSPTQMKTLALVEC